MYKDYKLMFNFRYFQLNHITLLIIFLSVNQGLFQKYIPTYLFVVLIKKEVSLGFIYNCFPQKSQTVLNSIHFLHMWYFTNKVNEPQGV